MYIKLYFLDIFPTKRQQLFESILFNTILIRTIPGPGMLLLCAKRKSLFSGCFSSYFIVFSVSMLAFRYQGLALASECILINYWGR